MRQRKAHAMTQGFRKIHETRCAEPSCEFYGTRAQQGVCFSKLNDRTTQYIQSVRKYADARMAEVKSLRKINKMDTDAKWIRYLESNLECQWMNEEFTMDQLIYLRAQVGTLTNRLAKTKKLLAEAK